ncbi:MAG: helix-turn-helix domain-containing protein [Terriglobia bacterium]
MPEDIQPFAFSLKHAAALAECSIGLLRQMIRKGSLKAVRLGNRWRIPRTEMLRICGATKTRIRRVEVTKTATANQR